MKEQTLSGGTFAMRGGFRPLIDGLTDTEAGILLKAIFRLVNGEDPEGKIGGEELQRIFDMIRSDIMLRTRLMRSGYFPVEPPTKEANRCGRKKGQA